MTLELDPSNEKPAPTPAMLRDQHTKRKANEFPTGKIGTYEESTGTIVVPVPSHLDNREKLMGSSPRYEGPSSVEIPEVSQSGAILKKAANKRTMRGNDARPHGGPPKEPEIQKLNPREPLYEIGKQNNPSPNKSAAPN